MPQEDEDARHRREQNELRAKRKASKMSKSEEQLEKERLRREHQQKILQKHGGSSKSSASNSAKRSKSSKAAEATTSKSVFQELFTTRASGFQIDFRFRNAPPRPPVGPTFVGYSLDQVLQQQCRQYKPLNSVEVNYTWKLHSEADLGVPLAPSAMDPKSYITKKTSNIPESNNLTLHPDDAALLDWKGSLGDTAADNLKFRREQTRAAARLALSGRAAQAATAAVLTSTKQNGQQQQRPNKKTFSRVLNEGMQTWMKKTTYLSNDYSRRVHNFKSLAQTKEELADDLRIKQEEVMKRRSVHAIVHSFEDNRPLQHPNSKNKSLKPKNIFQVLPNAEHWGRPFTHVVIDKKPALSKLQAFNQAIIAHVEKTKANARMSCQVFIPEDNENSFENLAEKPYKSVQSYDLDVIPLKEEDMPAIHFCFWVDRESGVVSYVPIFSRVQLSTGRPVRNGGIRKISRRPLTSLERDEMEERMAEVDKDLAEKHNIVAHQQRPRSSTWSNKAAPKASTDDGVKKEDDDGEDDFGDDSSDSGDEALFGGGGNKTIVAEG